MKDDDKKILADDLNILHKMGYAQELLRRMNAFSNFAISFSIICILAGGITSFHLGLSSVGGAAIGIGWPVSCLFSLACALAMGQIGSAFPTAGGLYHWSSILGGRGWGWITAWFNLIGLVATLAAINVGTVFFTGLSIPGFSPLLSQIVIVLAITFSQACINHRGIRLTSKLTDFSGYLIFAVSIALTISLLWYSQSYDFSRLITFENFSGAAGGNVWPENKNIFYLLSLSLLLPAYTITGFDASAHTAEETVDAGRSVPKGMIQAVFWASLFGWFFLVALILAIPDMKAAAAQGDQAFYWILKSVLPDWLRNPFYVLVTLAQYLCGLATLTSASRMFYAFARDGGLPFSKTLKKVSKKHKTPVAAIWVAAFISFAFTVYTPVYSTITVVCVIFLYVSYVLPVFLGFFAYKKSWKRMGPFDLGKSFKALAVMCVIGCGTILFVGVQPPNDKALGILVGALVLAALVWFGLERKRFKGPPR